jgi:hypothetical protein
MKRVLKPQAAVVVAGREEVVGAAAAADLIATVTAIATAAVAAAAEAEILARVGGSRPRIIATVPGSLANLAGNRQHVL